jgi:hypothetical protein
MKKKKIKEETGKTKADQKTGLLLKELFQYDSGSAVQEGT